MIGPHPSLGEKRLARTVGIAVPLLGQLCQTAMALPIESHATSDEFAYIAGLEQVDELLTNADADPEQVERLRAAGLRVTLV